jgi:GEVED domain
MKRILQNLFIRFTKKTNLKPLIGLFILFNFPFTSFTQCGAGYTRDTINWDYLDFLHTSSSNYSGTNPVTGLPFVTTAMAQTQYFGIAGNRMTLNTTLTAGGSGSLYGDVTTHTGEAGSFGVGEDVKFMGPASPATNTITLTFQSAVQDLKFSVYDIDRLQRITVTALDGATAKNITMASVSGAVLTITGNGTTSANAKASNTAVALTSTDGTANITISGSVTSVTITVSETTITGGSPSATEDGGFYLSDISACFANPSFPTLYYQPFTEPFTNQPAYFLANPQNLNVYMVNPANGVAEFIFAETLGTKMNSLAYDPINHWLYYVMDNSGAAPGNLTLKKYDFNTEPGTISTVIPNLATFGIPCFISGVELAGAAFYNGSLYLGIEGLNAGAYTGVESIIWKIDFDGSGNPTTYTQVFGTIGSGSSSLVHDWGDITIKDGALITHATIGNLSATNQYIHYNMERGTATTYTGNAETAGQLGQIYNGNVYRINNSVALYNENGTIGSLTPVTLTSCSPAWAGSAGDASDPFKPKCDFGDAPASYDPVALSPAVHQKHCNNDVLRLGGAWDREWNKNTSVDATGDATDEDGIGTVTILNSSGVSYNHVQRVVVTNNTGAPATLGGWLDYNFNGVFDASEGVIVTVPSTLSGTQNIDLTWPGLNIPTGSPGTFLRIRLVSGSTALTVNDATGWYDDGEVEDYPVVNSNVPLNINLLDFTAIVTKDKKVELKWSAISDNEADGFEIQRSLNQNDWTVIGWTAAGGSNSFTNYNFTDINPAEGKSYYRLRLVEKNGSSSFSTTRQVYIAVLKNEITLAPNPASTSGFLLFTGNTNSTGILRIRSLSGQTLVSRAVNINKGENRIPVDIMLLNPGIYVVELVTKDKTYPNKLSVTR